MNAMNECVLRSPTQDCPICFEPVVSKQVIEILKCNHSFHRNCLNEWINHGGGTCPMCRISIFDETNKEEEFIQSFPFDPTTTEDEEMYNALTLFFFEGYNIPEEVYEESIDRFSDFFSDLGSLPPPIESPLPLPHE